MGGGKKISGIHGVLRPVRRTASENERRAEGSAILTLELKRVEEALEEARRESESRYRDFFDMAPDLMAISDLETGRLMDVNQAFESWSGYARSEIIGSTTVELGFWPDSETRRAMAQRIVEGNSDFFLDVRLRTKSGEMRDVDLAGRVAEIGGKAVLFTVAHDVTERKLVEDALRESEERFRKFADEATSEGIIIHHGGRILDVNLKFADMFDRERSELIGMDPIVHIAPEYRGLVRSYMKSEYEQSYEAAGIRKDGSIFPVEIHAKSIPLHGKMVRAAAVRDLTERRRAEEALRRSEEKYRELVESANSIILRVDRDGKVTFFNEFAQSFFGYSEEEILGKNLVGTIVPEVDSSGRDLRSMVEGFHMHPERYLANVNENMLRNGERVWIAWANKPIHDERGRVIEVLCVGNDITERRRMEEKYRSIFENSISGIVQTTPEGRFINANPALARILGYDSPEELLELTDISSQIYMEPERRAELLKLIEERNVVQEFEVRVFRKDGTVAWVTANMRAVRDSAGRIMYVEGSIQDITDRKALESRLLQAEKMEAIGTLAGGIAHDFNNILAAIMGFTELTKHRITDEDPLRYLEQVLTACERAKNLVTQILTFSRKAENEMKPLDMGLLGRETLRLLRATLPSTIEIRSEIGDETYPVLADSTQMHQVLINLCTNAAHAMRERGGVLEVAMEIVEATPLLRTVHPDLRPGRYVKLAVRDNGTGIPPEIMDRIFDPFFTTKGVGEGTGLGLSVVYGIVKERGGTISVESKLNEGSAFVIYLPAISENMGPKVEESKSTQGGIERILFVDDERFLVEMNREVLRELGYKVLATTSSARALRVFRAQPHRFNLLITDMTMPEMTGLDLAAEVLNIRPDIPVILCTGYSDLATEQRARRLGVKEFIMKPVALSAMSQAVRRALDQGRDENPA